MADMRSAQRMAALRPSGSAAPGELQIDFGQKRLLIAGARVRIFLLVAVLERCLRDRLLQSGQITCSQERSDHVLPTLSLPSLSLPSLLTRAADARIFDSSPVAINRHPPHRLLGLVEHASNWLPCGQQREAPQPPGRLVKVAAEDRQPETA